MAMAMAMAMEKKSLQDTRSGENWMERFLGWSGLLRALIYHPENIQLIRVISIATMRLKWNPEVGD